MRTRPMWRMSRAARLARGLWPDANPLRRSSDRAEAGLLALLVIVFLAGAPIDRADRLATDAQRYLHYRASRQALARGACGAARRRARFRLRRPSGACYLDRT